MATEAAASQEQAQGSRDGGGRADLGRSTTAEQVGRTGLLEGAGSTREALEGQLREGGGSLQGAAADTLHRHEGNGAIVQAPGQERAQRERQTRQAMEGMEGYVNGQGQSGATTLPYDPSHPAEVSTLPITREEVDNSRAVPLSQQAARAAGGLAANVIGGAVHAGANGSTVNMQNAGDQQRAAQENQLQ